MGGAGFFNGSRRALLIFSVLLAGLSSTAQMARAQNTGTITGRVLDGGGQPLVGVQVYLVGRGLGT